MKPIRIGILSDTHLTLPSARFQALVDACFAGTAMILHAGDLTDLRVLQAFRGKEVHAVHGNMCSQAVCSVLPKKKVVIVGGFQIGIIHSAGVSYDFEEMLLNEFDGVDCIVYGHTHQPVCHRTGSVLYINPGSFMPTGRHGGPGTYAILEVGRELRGRIHEAPAMQTKLHSL